VVGDDLESVVDAIEAVGSGARVELYGGGRRILDVIAEQQAVFGDGNNAAQCGVDGELDEALRWVGSRILCERNNLRRGAADIDHFERVAIRNKVGVVQTGDEITAGLELSVAILSAAHGFVDVGEGNGGGGPRSGVEYGHLAAVQDGALRRRRIQKGDL